jgi:heat shock protein HslJ
MQNNLTIETGWMSRRACFTLPDRTFEGEYARALTTIAQSLILGDSPQRLQMILTNGERLEFSPLQRDPATQTNSAVPATEKSLKNTMWTLKNWKRANGSMRELPTGEQSLDLNFFDQGRADGYTGCNSMQATYAFTNGKLSIQPGVVTLTSCEEISRDQQGNRIRDNSRQILEQNYIDALSQIKTASIDIWSSSSHRMLMVLDNRDALEFERNPGWMTDARF